MSALTDFTKSAFTDAAAIIGTEALTIGGGTAVAAIFNEAEFSREADDGGFETEASLDAVIELSAFLAAYPADVKTYRGNKATGRGENWRVGKIRKGQSFVIIPLIPVTKSS